MKVAPWVVAVFVPLVHASACGGDSDTVWDSVAGSGGSAAGEPSATSGEGGAGGTAAGGSGAGSSSGG